MEKNSTGKPVQKELEYGEPVQKELEYTVTAPYGLQLRNQPKGEALAVLPCKSGVFVETVWLEENDPPEWLPVRTGELTGWVKAEFLRLREPQEDGEG